MIADDGGKPGRSIGWDKRNRRPRPAPHRRNTGICSNRITEGFGLEKHQRIHARLTHQLLRTASIDIAHKNLGRLFHPPCFQAGAIISRSRFISGC